MEVLRLEHVEKTYRANDHAVKAVRDVSFQIHEEEFTAIIGTSGFGKSTLLNLIGGLDQLTRGKIIVKGKETHQPEISLLDVKKSKDYRIFNRYRNRDRFREDSFFYV